MLLQAAWTYLSARAQYTVTEAALGMLVTMVTGPTRGMKIYTNSTFLSNIHMAVIWLIIALERCGFDILLSFSYRLIWKSQF